MRLRIVLIALRIDIAASFSPQLQSYCRPRAESAVPSQLGANALSNDRPISRTIATHGLQDLAGKCGFSGSVQVLPLMR